nr:MAG TPA: hypothetical protein [Herelleviridae sp.]
MLFSMLFIALIVSLPVFLFYIKAFIDTTNYLSWYIFLKDKPNVIKYLLISLVLFLVSSSHLFFILAENKIGTVFISLCVLSALTISIITQKP